MKSIAYTLLAFLAFSTFTSCVKAPEKESSGGSAPVTATTPVRWNTSSLSGGGLDFKVSESFVNSFGAGDFNGGGRHVIEQMMIEWNEASSLNFFRIPAQTVSNRTHSSIDAFLNDDEMGIYRSDSWFSEVDSRALAVAAYKAIHRNPNTPSHSLEILHADILINYRHHSFTTDSSDRFFYDLPSVMIHELGHVIGLKHVSNKSTGSVMYEFLGVRDVNRDLNSYDQNSAQSLYGVSGIQGSGSSNFLLAANSSSVEVKRELPADVRDKGDGTVIGLIELRSDGECRHYLDGKIVHSHQSDHHSH